MKYDTQKDSKGALEARRSVTEKKSQFWKLFSRFLRKGIEKGKTGIPRTTRKVKLVLDLYLIRHHYVSKVLSRGMKKMRKRPWTR